VISTVRGTRWARRQLSSAWSQAFATIDVGSVNTPRSPSAGSSLIANLGGTLHFRIPYPSSSLIPRSVYSPFWQKSHASTAHAEHGTTSGRRTTPATRSPGTRPQPDGATTTRPSDSWNSTNPV
jgi:hypothetical protein